MRYSFGPRMVLFWVCVVCSSMNVWASDAPAPTSARTAVISNDKITASDENTASNQKTIDDESASNDEVAASDETATKGETVTKDETATARTEEALPVPSTREINDLIAPPLLALYKSYQEQLSISTTAAATTEDGEFPALLNFTDGLRHEIPSLQPNDMIDWVDGGKWSVSWTGVVIRAMRDIRDWDPDQKYLQGTVPGYLIRCVMPNSPASRAGLLAGDVLLEMENDAGETVVVNVFSWWQWMRAPRNAMEKNSGTIVRFLRKGELLQTRLSSASASELPIFPHVWGHPSMPLGRLMIGIRPDGVVENVYVFWRPNGMASFMLFWQDPTKPTSVSMSVLEPNGGMYQVLKTEDLQAIPAAYIDYATYLWKNGQAEPAKIWVSSNRSGKSQSISYAKYAREQGINVEWVERLAKSEGIELPPIRKSEPNAEMPFSRNGQGPNRMEGVRVGGGPELDGPMGRGPEPDNLMIHGPNGPGVRRPNEGSEGSPWGAMSGRPPIPGETPFGTELDKPDSNSESPFPRPFPTQESEQRDGRGRNRGNNPWSGAGPNSGNKLTMSVMNPEMDALRTELRELRESVQQLQQTIVELNKKLDALKQE